MRIVSNHCVNCIRGTAGVQIQKCANNRSKVCKQRDRVGNEVETFSTFIALVEILQNLPHEDN